MMWDNSNGYEERDRRYTPQVQMPTPTMPITIPGTATSAQFAPASFPQTTGQPGGFVPPSPSYNVTPSYQGSGFSVYRPQVQWPQMQQGYTQPGYSQPGQPMMIQQSYSDQYVRSRKHSHSRSRSHSHSRNPSSHSHHHSRHRTHSHSHPTSQPQVIIAQPPSPNPILRPSRSYSQLPQVIQAPVHHSHHHRKSSSHSQTQPQVMFAQTPSPHPQHVIHQSHSFSNLPQAGAAQQFVHAANVLHSKARVPPKKYTSAKLSKIGRLPSANAVFQYSKCTGRKKALCIGINYLGQQNELRGCINDARHVRDFLISDWGYRPGDIVILTDDSQNPRQQPTRENILAAMEWLVRNARPHDSLFFHYSGHGGQTKDLNGDEVDGYDEVIFPVDFKQTKHIIDDEMHARMVKPLPPGCRLTALFDSCHSGTVLDLAYVYSSHGRLKGSQISSAVRDLLSTPADVISWSGCKDGQTSADTFHGGVAVGAMSWAFIQTLKQNPRQTYEELLRSLRRILAPKFDQTPQLGSSHRIDTSLSFIM